MPDQDQDQNQLQDHFQVQVQLHAPPILSTPETHILSEPTPQRTPRPSDEAIRSVYEVARTARTIRDGGWSRIALQFPDSMLGDAVRVFEALERELRRVAAGGAAGATVSRRLDAVGVDEEEDFTRLETSGPRVGERNGDVGVEKGKEGGGWGRHRVYILADTSYGACCVDEIAAEHVDAQVVVHYGRSCLSPTARLPVIYVFTSRPLDIEDVVVAFEDTYAQGGSQEDRVGKEEKVVLMADIIYHSHVASLRTVLLERGWRNVIAPDVVHDPSSLIPNRKVQVDEEGLKEYSIFHISDPPPALLLTLSIRVKDLYTYPISTSTPNPTTEPKTPPRTLQSNTSLSLRRRYAILTSQTTTPIFGILINTLSVKNYLSTVSSIKAQIAAAGKKSYTFVVGKINAAKIANFAEIGGWVVVGCWESSLIESKDFYRPIITPFELGLALQGDGERVWSGAWRGDLEGLKAVSSAPKDLAIQDITSSEDETKNLEAAVLDAGALDSEEESEPPDFDLRTGRYVSHSRPMLTPSSASSLQSPPSSSRPIPSSTSPTSTQVLARRAKLDLASVNGAVSPGAEYLRSQRTWTGLGSDFLSMEGDGNGSESGRIEEGRSGVARGYRVGEGGKRT